MKTGSRAHIFEHFDQCSAPQNDTQGGFRYLNPGCQEQRFPFSTGNPANPGWGGFWCKILNLCIRAVGGGLLFIGRG